MSRTVWQTWKSWKGQKAMNKMNSTLVFISFSLILTACQTPVQNNLEQVVDREDSRGIESLVKNVEYEQFGFYFNSLQSEQQKEIYEQIYDALKNRETEICIENINNETFKFLYNCVSLDNPNLFYVNAKYAYMEQKSRLVVYPEYSMTVTEQEQAEENIKVYTEEVLKQIEPSMTPYEKEKVIYDYIASNTEYATESEYNQSMYSVVQGQSVCSGYSKMFMYICQQEEVNIPCTIIRGMSKDGINHAWNCVYINGGWYMVDCTNSVGQLSDTRDEVSYHYFNITKEQMLRTNTINNIVKTPDCNSIEEEYYFKNGLYYDKVDKERIAEQLKEAEEKDSEKNLKGENSLEIRCSNSEVLNGLYDWLIDERNIYNILEGKTQVDYIQSNELLILKLSWK